MGLHERIEGDKCYAELAPAYAKTPKWIVDESKKDLQNRVRARQETVNKRLKQFGALSQRFRHDLSLHKIVVEAVAVITQLSILSGKSLFAINDYVD